MNENTTGRKPGKYEKTGAAMQELQDTVARLRAPDGCPWDRAQTHESLKAACVEEAAEVVCGINILSKTGKSRSLCEELGDLLLQVVMHAQIAEEEGLFSLEDVIRGINEKMIRRHPHVFTPLRRSESPCNASVDAKEQNTINPSETPQERPAAVRKGENEIVADWKEIKALEKKGREWEEAYLFEAFEEAETLIGVARKRKTEKKN